MPLVDTGVLDAGVLHRVAADLKGLFR